MSKMKCKTFQYFCLLFVFFHIQDSVGFTRTINRQVIWNATHTDKLRQDLLLNYDKFARPTQHYNTTLVSLGMNLKHLEVNEFKSQVTVYALVTLMWMDEKLKWNPEDYEGLNAVRLAVHEIWQPDIFLYNSATATAVGRYDNTHFVVSQNGQVMWVPPCQLTVICDLNLKYWPFDVQVCSLKFGSWTYAGDMIDLEIYGNKTTAEQELLVESSEWKITSTSMEKTTTYYYCCPEPYHEINVNITIARRSPSYKATIVTPGFAILYLILSSFWLPPNAGEKIILNGCAAIIISLFLLYFTQKIPAMGSHVPLIVLYYSSCLYIVAWNIVESVLVIWLSKTKHTSPIPWIIKKPLTGTLGKWLGLSVYIEQSTLSHRVTAEEMRDHHVTDVDDQTSNDDQIFSTLTKPSIQQEWVLLAAAIDRLCFVFCTLISLAIAVIYSI